MKKQSFAFLIHRPIMDYEESIQPYFICSTREQADAAMKRMGDFMDRLIARLPKYPGDEVDDPEAVKWATVDEQRQEILKKARWPFRIKLESDIHHTACKFDEDEKETWDRSYIGVMPLPLNP